MLPSPHVHLYAPKYMYTYISFSTGLCYGLVIVDEVILGSRFFWKSSWENFLFQASDGEKGFNLDALSKGYNPSVVQDTSFPGPALHFRQQCSNQTKVWDFNLFISGLQEANRESNETTWQLEFGGFSTVLRDECWSMQWTVEMLTGAVWVCCRRENCRKRIYIVLQSEVGNTSLS